MKREISIEDIKKRIIAAILARYDMTVRAFSMSGHPKQAGLTPQQAMNIPVYLSPSGAKSFPVLQKLYKYLGLGTLEAAETTKYFYEPKKPVFSSKGKRSPHP